MKGVQKNMESSHKNVLIFLALAKPMVFVFAFNFSISPKRIDMQWPHCTHCALHN